MNVATKSWQINRRELLRGGGIALALPLLNGMQSALGAATAQELPRRMVVSYIAYGVYEPTTKDGTHHEYSWWPCKNAGPLTFNKSTAPFEPLKDYVSYLRGLDHAGGYGLGGHSSGDIFATGANMSGAEKSNNISIDQLAAKFNGDQTRYPSLVLGTEGGTGSYGSCKTLSHYGPGKPIPALHNPREIFNRMFDPYAGTTVEQVRARLKREASVLDLMLENSREFGRRLGNDDQRKLEEYLDSVRAIEQRVARTSKWTHEALPPIAAQSLELEAGYQDPLEYTRCMYDLLYLALRTDLTRYASFMLESEQSTSHAVGQFAALALGYKGQTHDIAHKRPAESGLWDHWRASQHAYFLNRLRDTPEGDGNMLDRTVVLWGSAHPHGSHSNKNYPIQLAGGNALGLRHGNLHSFESQKKVPLANLYVSMLSAVGVAVERFADSTGPMTELTS